MHHKHLLFCRIGFVLQFAGNAQNSSKIISADSIVVSSYPVHMYPLVNDPSLINLRPCGFISPLLMGNGVAVGNETLVNKFRNNLRMVDVEKTNLKGKSFEIRHPRCAS